MMMNATVTAMVWEVAADDRRRQRMKKRLEQRGDRGFAYPSETEARHRDPELRRRDELVWIVERAPDGTRHAAALGQQLIDARFAH